LRIIGGVQPVRRILLGSALMSAAALTAAALALRERAPAALPQSAASSQIALASGEHVDIAGAANLRQPQEQRVDSALPVGAVTDAQIETVLLAHPELRPAIEHLLNDSDPNLRQQVAAMVIELAEVTAQTLPSK
jgi:hypothetical protein